MKPPPFEYQRVRSVGEALAARAEAGADGMLIAGGQSLGPMLNLRLVRPTLLVDIGAVDELIGIEETATSVRLGACVTHARIEDEAGSIEGLQPLARAARGIAYRAVRNRGTLGGSLAHADPAADWPLVMAAWGASVELAGAQGSRRVAADGFMSGAYVTALREGELLAAVHLPRLSRHARWVYRKFCRKPGEFAEAAAAVLFDPERSVARIFIGTPAGRPTSLPVLAGDIARKGRAALNADAIARACESVLADAPPARRQACHVMLHRALDEVLS
ncbi:MAG: FAD binding domain-containing protein [Burkholderiales bacterium]